MRISNRPKQSLWKTKKFTDGRVGNKFSRIAKVSKPNEKGKIKVTRIRCFRIQLWLFLKLKRGNESKEEGPRFYFAQILILSSNSRHREFISGSTCSMKDAEINSA
jgi:hypothetical protein